jgi:cystathionine beta-lyase/cystathionine gamma-synthase
MKLATKLIHGGIEPDPSTGAIMTPIFQTSTYVQAGPGKNKGYEYARSQNPTRTILEKALAITENAAFALSFASGMSATDTVMRLLKPGDEVIAGIDMYGGTYRMFSKVYEKFGIIFHYVDMTDVNKVKEKLGQKTRLIWVETPSNPLMSVVDIRAVADLTSGKSVMVCVDNTFASPYLQNPLDFGAHIVMHSVTKYLGGHSDVIMGCLMMNDPDLREQLYFLQKTCGAVPGPQDCFLILRGMKTLHLRMERHCYNGEKIAYFLRDHNKISKVNWCGFPEHPGYAIAKKQMRGFGGMMSFSFKDDNLDTAHRFLSSTKIFALAESLGGVESLLSHPASMTHAAIPREERLKNGLSDSLIRISIGVEDVDDLIADLDQGIGSL